MLTESNVCCKIELSYDNLIERITGITKKRIFVMKINLN